jgi:glutaconate CoA-transferase subunit B
MGTDANAMTPAQIMVSAASRLIADGEVVFVGMRLPLLGFLVAKSSHAPNAIGVYELGIVRDTPAPAPIMTMGDLPNLCDAQWLADTIDMMGLLQQGIVDVSFIGGAQVDRWGNLNTTTIKTAEGSDTRLPGSGGACDLACLAHRHIIIMKHEKRRFVPRVDYITSPGYGDGPGWREKVGLPRGGPAAVITTLGMLTFDPNVGELILTAVHPGVTSEDVRMNTGWDLKVNSDLREIQVPSASELTLIDRFDPMGYWTR